MDERFSDAFERDGFAVLPQVAGLLAYNAWNRSGKSFDLYFYEVDTGAQTLLNVSMK